MKQGCTMIAVLLIILLQDGPIQAQLVSKCAINGTSVPFHCPNVVTWYINHWSNFSHQETMFVLGNRSNIQPISSESSDIFTTKVGCKDINSNFKYATLLLTELLVPEPPLHPTLTPMSRTSISLKWQKLPRYSSKLPFSYNVTCFFAESSIVYDDGFVEEPNNILSLELDLEDYECQDFQINITVQGNCEAATIYGSLLLDPFYPMIENMQVAVLDNETLLLSWEQPRNIEFNELLYNYTLSISDASTEEIIDLDILIKDAMEQPVEIMRNVSSIERCKELRVSVSLLRDCRESFTTIRLPTFPEYFTSEVSAEVKFSGTGVLQEVDIQFQPPRLCEFQMASYQLTFTDGRSSWSTDTKLIYNTHQSINEEITSGIEKDRDYTITVTVSTLYGNVSSSTNFSTQSAFSELTLNEDTINFDILNATSVSISWENPANTLQNYFAYDVAVIVISTGKKIQNTIPFRSTEYPSAVFNVMSYSCERVEFVISILQSSKNISLDKVLPAYPVAFTQNISAEQIGNTDKIELKFTPPKMCDFQRVEYFITITSSNSTWSSDLILITNTSKEVEVIRSGFQIERDNYIVVVTVVTEFTNISSSANFNIIQPNAFSNTFSTSLKTMGGIAGGAVLIALLCGFGGGIMVVYFIRQRKARIRKRGNTSWTARPSVTNPIYETGNGIYEELPDLKPEDLAKTGGMYSNMAPELSSGTKHPTIETAPLEKVSTLSPTEKTQDKFMLLSVPRPCSTGDVSLCSTEDCYTVMSPTGGVTMLPRMRQSNSHNSMASGGIGPMEGRFTLNVI